MNNKTQQALLSNVLPAERPRLARLLTKLCSDAYVAEDLAQETLTEAWLNRHKLTDPQGYQKWLTVIAYNIYRRWRRQCSQEASRYTALDFELVTTNTPAETELGQSEAAHLVDEALALLPAETRTVFTAYYIEGYSQEQVARQLNTTQNVVAVRLHRGKLTLRRLLAAELDQQSAGDWQETRIWCCQCGQQRYQGRFNPTTEEFSLRCPTCDPHADWPAFDNKRSQLGLLSGVKGFKPALNRLFDFIDTVYPQAAQDRSMVCPKCNRQTRVQMHFPEHWPMPYSHRHGIYIRCECGVERYTALGGLAIASQAGRRFWQRYPRTRVLPVRQLNYDNYPALMVSFESLRATARLDVIYERDSYQLLGCHLNE